MHQLWCGAAWWCAQHARPPTPMSCLLARPPPCVLCCAASPGPLILNRAAGNAAATRPHAAEAEASLAAIAAAARALAGARNGRRLVWWRGPSPQFVKGEGWRARLRHSARVGLACGCLIARRGGAAVARRGAGQDRTVSEAMDEWTGAGQSACACAAQLCSTRRAQTGHKAACMPGTWLCGVWSVRACQAHG